MGLASETLLELENGKDFTEAEALIRLLEISSQGVKLGKTISAEDLKKSLTDKFTKEAQQ